MQNGFDRFLFTVLTSPRRSEIRQGPAKCQIPPPPSTTSHLSFEPAQILWVTVYVSLTNTEDSVLLLLSMLPKSRWPTNLPSFFFFLLTLLTLVEGYRGATIVNLAA